MQGARWPVSLRRSSESETPPYIGCRDKSRPKVVRLVYCQQQPKSEPLEYLNNDPLFIPIDLNI
ncbi:hypothetical protein AMS58_20290 [Pseudoalteromonas porphyrae]|nr:hypothetical protein AMS58_20290 [Pseudoalteromonas porphyrae]